MGTINATGGGGGSGGQTYYGNGGWGGGGAGGGILVMGTTVNISGSLNNRGRQRNTLSELNGGTIKIFYADMNIDSADFQTGRLYTNGRPRMNGLEYPENNTGTPFKAAFRWYRATDPEGENIGGYQLQVSSSPDFNTTILDVSDIKSTGYNSTNELTGVNLYWRVRASDAFGYGLWSEVWRFHTDTIPPVSRVLPLPEFVNTTGFEVSWSGTDDSTGLANYTIWTSENAQPFGSWIDSTTGAFAIFNGTDGHGYRFYSTAVDLVGNYETAHSVPDTFTTVDITPPNSIIAGLAPYQNSMDFKVGWSGNDNVSGIANYTIFYSENDGDFIRWQDNVTVLSTGFRAVAGAKYTFFVIARDRAGNLEPWPGPDKWFSTVVDDAPPSTAFHTGYPSHGKNPVYLSPATEITLNVTDTYGIVNNIYYKIDDRPALGYAKLFREGIAGYHNVTFWSVDFAGNLELPKTAWFFIDDQPPEAFLSLTGPNKSVGDRIIISSNTSIELIARDNGSGVARIEWGLDDAAYTEYMAPLMISGNGTHVLRFRAFDHLDQVSLERERKIEVDNTPPVTTAISPSIWSPETVRIHLLAYDEESGVQTTCFLVTKMGRQPGSYRNGTEVVLESAKDHSLDGTYIVEYYSIDLLGNAETPHKLAVRIDTLVDLTLNLNGDIVVELNRFLLQGKAEPGSNVTVNGVPAMLLPDGTFVSDLRLSEGRSNVVVHVIDPAGNDLTVTHSITYYAILSPDALAGFLILIIITVAIAIFIVFNRKRRMAAKNAPLSKNTGREKVT